MKCSRCECLPDLCLVHSNVYLKLPTHHLIEPFEIAMKEHKYRFSVLEDGYLVCDIVFERFVLFLSNSVFNSVEQKDIKLLPLNNKLELTYSSLENYKSLATWLKFIQGKEVAAIISESRIKTLFQPIIKSDTGEIYGYEALSRGVLKDGTNMNPEVLFSTAKDMGLLFYLDRVCRESSIRAAAKHGITKKLFINFIPTAIYEPSLCLQSTAKVLNEVKIDANQVVFEVVETEKVEDYDHLNTILNYYKEKGYSTALDDIGSGFSTIESLVELKPDYMKIDMNVIRDIHVDSRKQELLDEFISNGKKIGLAILAEGIESFDEYNYLKTKHVDLMQGFLFGRPKEVPQEKIAALNFLNVVEEESDNKGFLTDIGV